MEKKRTVKLIIDNCLCCPRSKIVPSFTGNQSEQGLDVFCGCLNDALVVANITKVNVSVPAWCPLPEEPPYQFNPKNPIVHIGKHFREEDDVASTVARFLTGEE